MFRMENVLGCNRDGSASDYAKSVADRVIREAQIGTRMIYNDELKALLCQAVSMAERDLY